MGLAWAGQAMTTRTLPHVLAPLDLLASAFWVYPNKREISAAFILLVAGALVLAIAAFRHDDADLDERMLVATRPFRFGTRNDLLLWVGAAVGVLLWGVFLWRLYGDHYQHTLNLIMLAALLLVAAPFAARDRTATRVRWHAARSWLPHAAFLAAVTGGFIYLNLRDLGSWKYAAVGDEYANFNYALGIAKGAFFNPWSHRGADDLFSVFGAAGQALFLKIGNEDNFAWKSYSVFAAAISFVPFYLLIRELFRARVAVLATVLFACSHYIFGYAHHFLYLDGMFPTALGLWLLVVGLRRDSALALFAGGLALGLGFYTFESGRAAVVVAALFMLTFGTRAFRPAVFVPLAGGFILLTLPLFATDGPAHVFDQMFGQSAISYSSEVTGDRYERLIVNLQFSFVSFNFMTEGRHYVWGSMADPLTAMLYVLGLGVVVPRINRPAYRLLFIWWLVEVAFNGFTNPYPKPPISRMHAVVPPVAALAAIAVDAIVRPIAAASPHRRLIGDRTWQQGISWGVVVALFPLVLYLNLHRFWAQLPVRYGPPSWEPVVLRAYREPQCEGKQAFIITRSDEQSRLFANVFRSYRIEPPPYLMSHSDAFARLDDGLPENVTGVGCVIVQSTDRVPEDALVLEQVAHTFPEFQELKVTDLRGNSFAVLFAAP
ncbi:MAG: glycosyltransferase family 39 protein [Chloroflexi bacterium]|nr:glycosyltransferase family 39 protein [Chloroflexota bacterium]